METQVINNNGKSSKAAEALKKVAPIVGGAAAGIGTFVASDVIASESDDLEVVEPIVPPTENADDKEDDKQNTEEKESTHATSNADNNTTGEHQPQVDTPQDQHNTESQSSHTDPSQAIQHPEHEVVTDIPSDDIPIVDPDVVSQDIITDDVIMVDPNDNDVANMAITSVGTLETTDGQVLTAAELAGENGDNVYMVDVDGDNTYDLVEDASGNILGEVPTTITVGDSESIADINNGETGYLASSDTDNNDIAGTDNPMEDVIALG